MNNFNSFFAKLTVALTLLTTVAFSTTCTGMCVEPYDGPQYFSGGGSVTFKVERYATTRTPKYSTRALACTISLLSKNPSPVHLLVNTQDYTPANSAARDSEQDISAPTTELDFYEFAQKESMGTPPMYVYFDITSKKNFRNNPLKIVCAYRR